MFESVGRLSAVSTRFKSTPVHGTVPSTCLYSVELVMCWIETSLNCFVDSTSASEEQHLNAVADQCGSDWHFGCGRVLAMTFML